MSTFGDQLRGFVVKTEQMTEEVHLHAVLECERSIKFGSEITGAPGQPVDTAALRNSWQREFVAPHVAEVTTNLEYAEPVEEGLGSKGQPVVYGAGGYGRSQVGGSHSVKLTIAGFQRIVDACVARVKK